MININVHSHMFVEIENEDYVIKTRSDLVKLIRAILDKAVHSGETIYLGTAKVDKESGETYYSETGRWR